MHQCNDPSCDICNRHALRTAVQAGAAAEEAAKANPRASKPTPSFPNRKARRRSMKRRGEFRKP